MTLYVTLEPSFDGVTTGNYPTFATAMTIVFIIVMIVALRAVCKKMIDSRLPEENNEEEN